MVIHIARVVQNKKPEHSLSWNILQSPNLFNLSRPFRIQKVKINTEQFCWGMCVAENMQGHSFSNAICINKPTGNLKIKSTRME